MQLDTCKTHLDQFLHEVHQKIRPSWRGLELVRALTCRGVGH